MKINPVEACVAPVVALVAILTSDGDHFRAIPRRYATYHAAETANPIFRPMYAVTPLNTAPIRIPIRIFEGDQWEISKPSWIFFSSRYCSSNPVLRLLYISSSNHVREPSSIALRPFAVTGRRYADLGTFDFPESAPSIVSLVLKWIHTMFILHR